VVEYTESLHRYVVIKGGNLGSEVAHAGLFTDILSHVPRARRIDVHTDLAKCIPAFVRAVEEHQSSHVIYFDRFDMPPVDFVNGQPPPFLSNINPRFSNVCTTTMIVHDRTDFTYLADWIDTGLRMEEIVMLDSPFVAKAWSAHTYPGLKRFYVADYVDKLPNEPMVHRFLSRHRSLDEIVVGSYDTGPGVNPDKFLCSLSLGRAAGIEEVRIRRMRFVRIKPPPPAQSDDIVPFRCEFLMLSYPAIASSTEALASVVESLPKCLPGLQHLLVGTEDPTENLKWRLSSTDLNSVRYISSKSLLTLMNGPQMFANPITSSGFSELCVLALEHFWPPADLPAVPEHFQTCSVHTEGSQDTTPASCLALRLLCYSLRLSFDIACVMPRLQRVTLKWHTSEEFNEACCVDIPADYYVQRQHGTQMVLKVTDNDKSVSWPSEDIT